MIIGIIKSKLFYNEGGSTYKKEVKIMPRSNIKLLTKDERRYFKNNYAFSIKDDFILVKFNGYGRTVAHPIDEDFSIASKVRKIKISKDAIKLWKDKFQNTEYSVIDIQDAMNALLISYQATNFDDVKSQLEVIKKNDEKIVL
jgi:predicted acetyltransferase